MASGTIIQANSKSTAGDIIMRAEELEAFVAMGVALPSEVNYYV